MKNLIGILLLLFGTSSIASHTAFTEVSLYDDSYASSYRLFTGVSAEDRYGLNWSAGTVYGRSSDSGHYKTYDGIFFGVNGSVNSKLKFKTRFTDTSAGNIYNVNVYGSLREDLQYDISCERDVVDSYGGLGNQISFKSCNGSLEYTKDHFGVIGGHGRYEFSDNNVRKYDLFKLYFDVNENIRLEHVYKEINNSLQSDHYFSPRTWMQNYGMIRYSKSYDNIGFNIGVGYGPETINGFTENTTYTDVRFWYDKDNWSINFRAQNKDNGYNYMYYMIYVGYSF